MSERIPTYVESTIIMTTVRIISPFAFTYGLFVMLHGAESAGGGFQGGVILAASLILVAFAYGIEPTRDWITDRPARILIATGGATFVLIGLVPMALGYRFLEYEAYAFHHGTKYGIELVELGIGAIVFGVILSLFMSLAAGHDFEENGGENA
ncbi:MnhB domain-containing protein [Halodesulfurarchaeum sp. HSR-GB]|uniref:MnhB domain-containing protein n=1 Tax=Halodesulfurarchaeum sp. HSR-GB TaxID=3074077 RepID=UPI00286612F4|nr:MnhB domain-containing protein [Halodesulfurarchaeum sp. HSR-GB]MDR5657196.1 MnhB domain-containing protein [Halodesulfurarchaeum sp. HSR-GB]